MVFLHGHGYYYELCMYLREQLGNARSGEALSVLLAPGFTGRVESHRAGRSRELYVQSL